MVLKWTATQEVVLGIDAEDTAGSFERGGRRVEREHANVNIGVERDGIDGFGVTDVGLVVRTIGKTDGTVPMGTIGPVAAEKTGAADIRPVETDTRYRRGQGQSRQYDGDTADALESPNMPPGAESIRACHHIILRF